MNAATDITIKSIRVRAAMVPRPRPLVFHSTVFSESPLLLIDLETSAGITGRAYLFGYQTGAVRPLADLLRDLGALLKGETLAPLALARKMAGHYLYLGLQGITQIAISGIDMAAWDALAKASGQPLAGLLGSTCRALPAYDSTGLGKPEAVASEAREIADAGFGTLKVKLGYPDVDGDLAVLNAIRDAVPGIGLMVDYNQRLSLPEARKRLAALASQDLIWVEEPLDALDNEGHAQLRRDSQVRIQLGENWWNARDAEKSARAQASDFAMLDVGRIGGVTGWLECAAVAHANGLPLSSHFYPEISAHLMCATAGADWLEFLEWASPILTQPVSAENGRVLPGNQPGSGVEWDEAAVARYEIPCS